MVKSTKKHPQRGNEKKSVIHNPYGSTSCIRFEGIISAPSGHPFVFYAPKLHKKRKRQCRFPKKSMPTQDLYAHPIFLPRQKPTYIMRLPSTARPFTASVKLYTPKAILSGYVRMTGFFANKTSGNCPTKVDALYYEAACFSNILIIKG